jgi:hypothetical protein
MHSTLSFPKRVRLALELHSLALSTHSTGATECTRCPFIELQDFRVSVFVTFDAILCSFSCSDQLFEGPLPLCVSIVILRVEVEHQIGVFHQKLSYARYGLWLAVMTRWVSFSVANTRGLSKTLEVLQKTLRVLDSRVVDCG